MVDPGLLDSMGEVLNVPPIFADLLAAFLVSEIEVCCLDGIVRTEFAAFVEEIPEPVVVYPVVPDRLADAGREGQRVVLGNDSHGAFNDPLHDVFVAVFHEEVCIILLKEIQDFLLAFVYIYI